MVWNCLWGLNFMETVSCDALLHGTRHQIDINLWELRLSKTTVHPTIFPRLEPTKIIYSDIMFAFSPVFRKRSSNMLS